MTREFIARVAVDAATYAIDKPYDYRIPEALRPQIRAGVRVRVNFGRGNRRTEGIVLDVRRSGDGKTGALKPIISVIDDEPVISEGLIRLGLWIREQCFCTFFDVLRAMLPSGLWYKFDSAVTPLHGVDIDTAEGAVSEGEYGKEIVRAIFNAKSPCKKLDLSKTFGDKNVEKTIKTLSKLGYVEICDCVTKNVSDKTERLVRLDISRAETEKYIERKKVRASVHEALELLCNVGTSSVKELCYFTGITPSQLKTLSKNGVISFEETTVYRRPKPCTDAERLEITLNTEQQKIFESLSAGICNKPSCALLYGVTGSGKTAIYFKLIEKVISKKKTAIMLVPEISLTPQLLELVYSYFGERTAVMHSALSPGERYDEWKRIKNGEVDVVVGTRSAIFAPLENIGIIILDEEQESTYKSSSNPRYHARDVAKFRCVSESAMLLLGSATPSVESMHSAKIGKYKLERLQNRFNERPLPEVIVADMRRELSSGRNSAIGSVLFDELKRNIENGEQSILFLNRRGASKYAVCDSCEEVPGCPNCSVPLVYHSTNSRLMCHHCGFSQPIQAECTKCGGRMRFVGFGTQRVEQELHELFPKTEIIRMDMDTTSAKRSHELLLSRFRDERIPILLGTQMITKGLDFENVTLVGVLAADQAIFNENYKASENAFSLITQVVGRAGRGNKSGRAVIQTYAPNNLLINYAAAQDYDSFYESEIRYREMRNLPPFTDIFSFLISGMTEIDVLKGCMRLSGKIKRALESEYPDVKAKLLGPAPAAIVRVNGKYRYKMSVYAENSKRTRELVSRLIRDFLCDKQNKTLSIIPDINTTDF